MRYERSLKLSKNQTHSADISRRLSADDFIEILQLYAKYCFALDTGNGKARGETFASDGTFAFFQFDHIPEPIDSQVARTNEIGNRGHRHFNSNIIIEATPEGARGSCHALTFGRSRTSKGDGYVPIGNEYTLMTGFYQDTLVKTAEGWRFKTRELYLDHEADSPFAAGKPPGGA